MRHMSDKEISLNNLYTVQPELIKSKLLSMSKDDNVSTEDIVVQRVGGKNIIMDGNHRLQPAVLKGEKTINVKFADVDKIRKDRLEKLLAGKALI